MDTPTCVSCGASLLGEGEGEILCVVDEQWRLFCPQCAEALGITPLSLRIGHVVVREHSAWEREDPAGEILDAENAPQARFRFFDVSRFDQELCEASTIFHSFFGSYPDTMVASSSVHEQIDYWANMRRGNFIVDVEEERSDEFFPVAQLQTRVATLTFAVDDSLGDEGYVLVNMNNEAEDERTGGGVCTGCGTPLKFDENGLLESAVDSYGRLYCDSCRHTRFIQCLESTFDEPLHRENSAASREYDITVEFRKEEIEEALTRFVDLEQFDKELDQVSRGFLRAFQRAPKIMVAGTELYERIDEIARARPENLEGPAIEEQQKPLFDEELTLGTIETTVSELTLALDDCIDFPGYILVRDDEAEFE